MNEVMTDLAEFMERDYMPTWQIAMRTEKDARAACKAVEEVLRELDEKQAINVCVASRKALMETRWFLEFRRTVMHPLKAGE